MPPLPLPTILRKPKEIDPPFLKPMIQMGPRTFSGRQQLGAPDAGWWVMRMTVEIAYRAELLALRSFVSQAQGGLTALEVPIFDERQAVTPALTGVTLSAALAVGATSATFSTSRGSEIEGGMFFSINRRLYQVIGAPVVDSVAVPPTATVSFLPPARQAHAAATGVQFDAPVLTARLSNPMTGQVTLGRNYFGDVTIEFEEWLDAIS